MAKLFGKWIGITLLAVAGSAMAEELISKNYLSAGEDWYLLTDSIRPLTRDQANVDGVYIANHYLSMYEPDDSLENFDGDGYTIGYEFIGEYQSYAYVSLFDCKQQLEATLRVSYYSGVSPSSTTLVHRDEYYSSGTTIGFFIPNNEDLLNRVCEIARAR
ncbi:hypothetical protein OAP54_02235 [Planktomarina temperata]|nr:hypothetical protein [Planktomarina temperata]